MIDIQNLLTSFHTKKPFFLLFLSQKEERWVQVVELMEVVEQFEDHVNLGSQASDEEAFETFYEYLKESNEDKERYGFMETDDGEF